ncbi:cytochrome P450 [Mycotypha africana]|uniref:cytochrome P450 n=1 Tax=Mycotypha africana TaxID=64632 RepID=UPI002301E4F2|nr:cytochrome P450 [Mycotypha africana]KAI8967808.1 cytochrome P450 [Mycotypha africana]
MTTTTTTSSIAYALPLSLAILSIALYVHRRYVRYASLAKAPIAPAHSFFLKYFGIVPPPSEKETHDALSHFLIRVGRQDTRVSPVSVCWSIFGTPLVIVNTLKGIKDVLIEGQSRTSRSKGKAASVEKGPQVQRGMMIRLVHHLVFGGMNLNNTVGEDWRWRRHVLLPSFQPKQLVPHLLPYVASRARELLDTFTRAAASGQAIELDDLFTDLTMDVINFYLYGRKDLNYAIVGGKRNMKSLEVWLPFGLNRTKWAQKSFKPSRDRLKHFIHDSLDRALQDYHTALADYEASGTPPSRRVYRSVAACAFASGRYGEDRVDLVNDLLALTFAGYDTTAHTLSFCFAELARHPDLQEQLFQEVRAVLGPAPLDPATITAEKLAKMPLVTAVYKEALRMYPAVVFIPMHVNRAIQVDGTVVPEGAAVWCNVRGIQMNPALFPEPEKFDPSRWLRPVVVETTEDAAFDHFGTDTTDHVITPDTQYTFPDLPFTLGQHACIGKNLATLELRTTIACTVNEFKFNLAQDCIIDTKVVLTTKPRHGVWVHFEKRT